MDRRRSYSPSGDKPVDGAGLVLYSKSSVRCRMIQYQPYEHRHSPSKFQSPAWLADVKVSKIIGVLSLSPCATEYGLVSCCSPAPLSSLTGLELNAGPFAFAGLMLIRARLLFIGSSCSRLFRGNPGPIQSGVYRLDEMMLSLAVDLGRSQVGLSLHQQ